MSLRDGNTARIPCPPTATLEDYIKIAKPSRLRARRESRTTSNGTGTVTLRRTSTTPVAQPSSQAEAPLPTATTEVPVSYQQPNSIYEQPTEFRYTKNQLLDIYKAQRESGGLDRDISHLFENGWDPTQSNGANGRASWGKSSDGRDNQGPNIAWEPKGNIEPLSLQPMTEEEKNVSCTIHPHCDSADSE